MNRSRIGWIPLIALALACASAPFTPPPRLSAAQREAIQTREFPGRFDTVFPAVLSVLQDEGWEITEVDRESGLIQASSLRRQSLFGPADDWRGENDPVVKETRKRSAQLREHGLPFAFWTRWNELTARIEPWHRNSVRVRLSIVKHGTLPSSYR
jgi:hypothetical protein